MEVEAGPNVIDISLKTPRPIMESLVPAVRCFASGGQFKMPHNLEISQQTFDMVDTEASKYAEIAIVKRIASYVSYPPSQLLTACELCGQDVLDVDKREHALEHDVVLPGPELEKRGFSEMILQNPSPMIMSVLAEKHLPSVLCSEEYVTKYTKEVEDVQELKDRWTMPRPQVMTFPYLGDSLVYTGSLGVPGRTKFWLGLQPAPWGPSVLGRQNIGWGLLYQYSRKGRTREMVFEYTPSHYRYTTLEYFGISSELFVITNLKKEKQTPSAGVGFVLGFTDDPSPRYHGRLGLVAPLGKYVVRADTVYPERHTAYVEEKILVGKSKTKTVTLVHYGSVIYSCDRERLSEWAKRREIEVVTTDTFCQVSIPYPLDSSFGGMTFATFWDREGKHSERVLSNKFGAMLAPKAAITHDQEMVTYASGSPVVRDRLPIPQHMMLRERALGLLYAGEAILDKGELKDSPDSLVIVASESMKWKEFFRRLWQRPQRGTLLTHKEEEWLRSMGHEMAVGEERRITVFPRQIPLPGWALIACDSLALEKFDD